MSWVYALLLGFTIGVLLMYYIVTRSAIGTLKATRDYFDDDLYLYVELDRPYFPKNKYVVMRVDDSQN